MQAIYCHDGKAIDHTPDDAVAAGDVVLRGDNLVTVAKLDIPADTKGAVHVTGAYKVVKDDSDVNDGDPLYWDANGDPVDGDAGSGAFSSDPETGPFAGWALEDAGPSVGTILLSLNSRDAAVAVARDALVQDDLQPYPITVSQLRVWDAPHTNAVGTPANDDLGIVYNTFLTLPPSIETGDLKAAGATSRKVGFQVALPPEYVAGQTATLRINAGMKTTVADTSATVDAQAARQAGPTVDVVATAAQSINSLTPANMDFTITPTDCVPGDILDVVLTVAVNDGATVTAVIGKIYKVELLLDIKG